MPRVSDSDFMMLALSLAERGEGHTRPNPPVGAVLVNGGQIIGRGWHRRCGLAHAEVAAIENAVARGNGRLVQGSTIYVTLEPCSRPGRVGACTDAIADAGVDRVVYAMADPNPTNRRRAKRVLAAHGVACECLSDACHDERTCEVLRRARRLIAPFAKRMLTGLPFVTVKIAMSLDGRICDDSGDAKWISSSASRRRTGEMRAKVDAIMVGAETVRRDNPSLLCHTKRNDDLIRAIVSKSGRLPRNAKVFTDGAVNETVVYRDPMEALADLGRRGVMHVLCEGGLSLATALVEANAVDEWITVLSPVVIGHRRISEAVRPFGKDSDAFCAFPRGGRNAVRMV